MHNLRHKISRRIFGHRRVAVAGASLGICVAICPLVVPQAQRAKESGVNVTGVSSRSAGADSVVSIEADGPLTRAQTWQDGEGFHVVVYKGQGSFRGVPRGVKVRRVGDSLELVVPVKPGRSVYVQPRFNNLDLVVSGGLHAATDEGRATQTAQTSQRAERAQRETNERASKAASKSRAAANNGTDAGEARESVVSLRNERAKANLTPALPPPAALKLTTPNASQPIAPNQNSNGQVINGQMNNGAAGQTGNGLVVQANNGGAASPSASEAAASGSQLVTAPNATGAQEAANASFQMQVAGGSMNRLFIVLAVCFSVGLGAFAFIFMRSRRKTKAATHAAPEVAGGDRSGEKKETTQSLIECEGEVSLVDKRKGERRKEARRAEDKQALVVAAAGTQSQSLEKAERKSSTAVHVNVPAVIFGAYQIEQEVEKLVTGAPHSIEVLASRAPDDRRAIEAFLLKALHSETLGQKERERARYALEEYGFVARHSAAVLMASDAYERSSAARALGAMRSRASLPFLLEALYDGEHIVCTEAVKSLGALGQPSAIGALLDMARRHPEIPAPLVRRALSACSVDCLNLEPSADGDTFAYHEPAIDPFTGEIRGLEPVEAVEQLPEWMEDESLADALERLDSADVEARVAAAQKLAQFQVQRSVQALTSLATNDRDSAVRAAAVTSLGNIGHESVFPSVLISMADEAREVRAAAARALSRLSFDRADAYVRVLETADAETLRHLASACVGAGLAKQALSRLASEDRRQAYEAFSLLSLVAKGGQSELILSVVEAHQDLNMRLAAARLLGLMCDAETDARLRRVALGANAPEKLRTAILEAIYRGEPQAATVAESVEAT
ncbi:MAG TPA: HEAT repeat domain-containing protein [Pyrinomonadaceae bacterium]|nr:HEAT repeat domain-containing protein [Pyrinomonadaceae bacterium]